MPVPLHWIRKWRRGYNQAEVIAREVAAELGAPLDCRTLVRRRRTQTQTKLDVKDKTTNVAGAFKVRKRTQDSEGQQQLKHILLIDDLFTTGSTLMACFTALREVFPPSVRISVATLAFVGEA
jgi:ComF family protein